MWLNIWDLVGTSSVEMLTLHTLLEHKCSQVSLAYHIRFSHSDCRSCNNILDNPRAVPSILRPSAWCSHCCYSWDSMRQLGDAVPGAVHSCTEGAQHYTAACDILWKYTNCVCIWTSVTDSSRDKIKCTELWERTCWAVWNCRKMHFLMAYRETEILVLCTYNMTISPPHK